MNTRTLYERTKQMIFNKPIGQYDFILQSKDRKSNIIFTFMELELKHLSSINYLVNINDHKFSGEVSVWIEKEMFSDFIEDLIDANNKRTGSINLRSMSSEEMEINFISQRFGRYEIAYSIKRTGYSENTIIQTLLKGSFEYDIEFFNPLEEKLKEINKILI
ncbi:hypothetical protein [Paenibacillus mendelii]|uniref:Uncharacterized protein n=1 Tax=Paenibacillus mendelii TaxID=206163 RepID=A0ABV6JFU4_9BACL|nr:hypothetical protein [Paenibacillus mendelii]MCQ6557290.1 hypothetical protein [Paenibacillus mendelii]